MSTGGERSDAVCAVVGECSVAVSGGEGRADESTDVEDAAADGDDLRIPTTSLRRELYTLSVKWTAP